MRRLIVLALLFGGTRLILPLGSEIYGAQALLAFGFLVLAAYTVGEIANSVGLPKIVGYLVAGMAFGPHGLGAVSESAAAQLTPVNQLAIALIAFLAGAELRWAEVRERGVALLKITGTELLVTWIALFAAFVGLASVLPFLGDASRAQTIALGLLFASIAVVHSPAVTLEGARERALAAGCDDHLAKPINVRAFLSCVERWLQTEHAAER